MYPWMHSSYDTLQSSHQCMNMQVGSPHFMLIRIWEYLPSWDNITHPQGIPPVSQLWAHQLEVNMNCTFYNSWSATLSTWTHNIPVLFPDYLQTISLGMRLVSVRCKPLPSLVPRPFPPPVFDCLQYAKKEGGRPRKRDEESWGPCNILSKTLRLKHLKDVNNACCLVDSRLINARFVSYDNRAPPPSRLYPHDYLMSCTWLFLPGLPCLAYCKQSKTGGGNGLGMRLVQAMQALLHEIHQQASFLALITLYLADACWTSS